MKEKKFGLDQFEEVCIGSLVFSNFRYGLRFEKIISSKYKNSQKIYNLAMLIVFCIKSWWHWIGGVPVILIIVVNNHCMLYS